MMGWTTLAGGGLWVHSWSQAENLEAVHTGAYQESG